MAEIHESVASFLNALTSGLEELLSATVSWTPRAGESSRPDLLWWSCGLSVDSDCRFLAGAPAETWDEMAPGQEDHFAPFAQVMQQSAQARFGSEVSCTDAGPSDEPSAGWTAVTVSISFGTRACPPLDIVLNPELEAALGSGQPAKALDHPSPNLSSVDMLMHVEIPVSVLLGRTQMRMKDLLGLTHGSIVELDQELSDEVEIRVSNCTIARGEVVAVDGNYGVRILKMISGRETLRASTGST